MPSDRPRVTPPTPISDPLIPLIQQILVTAPAYPAGVRGGVKALRDSAPRRRSSPGKPPEPPPPKRRPNGLPRVTRISDGKHADRGPAAALEALAAAERHSLSWKTVAELDGHLRLYGYRSSAAGRQRSVRAAMKAAVAAGAWERNDDAPTARFRPAREVR